MGTNDGWQPNHADAARCHSNQGWHWDMSSRAGFNGGPTLSVFSDSKSKRDKVYRTLLLSVGRVLSLLRVKKNGALARVKL